MQRATFITAVSGLWLAHFAVSGAATPVRVAIVASPGDDVQASDVNRFVAHLGHNILQNVRYNLLSRTHLDAVLSEQGLSNSAYADPATAAKLGKVAGASRLLHVTLTIEVQRSSGLMEHETTEASSDFELIDVDSARILSNGSAEGSGERSAAGGGDLPGSSSDERRAALDSCADDLVSQLALT